MYIDNINFANIPEADLASSYCKYIVGIRIGERLADDVQYILLGSTLPVAFVPASVSGEEVDLLQPWGHPIPMTAPGNYIMAAVASGMYEWQVVDAPEESATGFPVGNITETVDEVETTTSYTVVFANHDIYELEYLESTNSDGETVYYGIHTDKVYFAKTGQLMPSPKISLPMTTMEELAAQVKRLVDNSGSVSASQMVTKLSSLSVIGDLVDGTITTFNGYNVSSIRSNAFKDCTKLTTVTLPTATTVKTDAFNGCTALTSVSATNTPTVEANAFSGCTALAKVTCSSGFTLNANAFSDLTALTTFTQSSTSATTGTIGSQAFSGCTALATLTLQSSKMIVLENADAFRGTPIEALTGSIKVHKDLVATYQADAAWSKFASIISAVS